MPVKTCFNCGTSHGPLKRYYWNTRTAKGNISSSHYNLLCGKCAKSLGGWQQAKQEEEDTKQLFNFPENMTGAEIDEVLDAITIGTPEEAARVAMSLTDEDIERLEREEKFSSLN
jgi:hypothetical protein